jgi:hypothetical protein
MEWSNLCLQVRCILIRSTCSRNHSYNKMVNNMCPSGVTNTCKLVKRQP